MHLEDVRREAPPSAQQAGAARNSGPAQRTEASEAFAELRATAGYRVQPADNDTDTAALLRELSALGLEDEPSTPAATRSAPRPPR